MMSQYQNAAPEALLARLRQHETALAMISSMSHALARQTDVQEIINTAGEKIQEVFRADSIHISLYDHETNSLSHRYSAERGKRVDFSDTAPVIDHQAHIIHTRNPLIIGSFEDWIDRFGDQAPAPSGAIGQSWMGVPVIWEDRVMGIISVQQVEDQHFYKDVDAHTLSAIASIMGAALEKARLLEEAHNHARELEIVKRINVASSSAPDINEFLHLVGEQMRLAFNPETACIALHNTQTHMIEFPYVLGEPLVPVHYGTGWASHILSTGKSLLLSEDAGNITPELRALNTDNQVSSYLGVPVVVGRKPLGVLSVQNMTRSQRFTNADEHLLAAIAANVGLTLLNAQLSSDAEAAQAEALAEVEEWDKLNHITRTVSAIHDLEESLKTISRIVVELLHARNAGIALLTADKRHLNLIANYSTEPDLYDSAGLLIPLEGNPSSQEAVHNMRPVILPNAQTNPLTASIHDVLRRQKSHCLMIVPLITRGNVIGTIGIDTGEVDRVFTPAEVRLAEMVAGQVAGAIESTRLFTEAQEARAQAEAANESKSAFLASVSHELRTPLTSVLGFARIIQKQLITHIFPVAAQSQEKSVTRAIAGVTEDLDIILSEGERLTALINNVLDLAKIEAGKVDWRMEAVNMNKVIEHAVAATTALFASKSLEMVTELDPTPAIINADRDRMIQVMINLISNAVKFTDTGSVTCCVEQHEDSLVVSVKDTGIGIAPEDIPNVFEKFKQVGDTLINKPKGTGLGLPICKEIIEAHGGRLWVESQVGAGSTFCFSLPLLIPNANVSLPLPMQLQSLIEQLKAEITEQVLPAQDSKLKLLVVDDDDNIRTLMRKTLTEEGYDVCEAANGADAILLAQTEHPALIILDVLMPGISGFDVVAALKNQPETKMLPVVILSIVEDQERGYRLGVDRYLTKPIDTTALLHEIATLVKSQPACKTVLIADSNPETVRQLRAVLSSQQYVVSDAADTQQFWQKVLDEKPSLIIAHQEIATPETVVKLHSEDFMKNILLYT